MKRCWDSDPFKRPNIISLENTISEWLRCINEYYKINSNNKSNLRYEVSGINSQLRNDMEEFLKANEILMNEQASTIVQSHSQAYFTSRLLDFTKDVDKFLNLNSEGFDCMITD